MDKILENRLKTWEVLKWLDIEIYQLFELCKKGELQAYTEYGEKVYVPDLCELGKKDSFDEILNDISIEEASKLAGRLDPYATIEKQLKEKEQIQKAHEIYNAQPLVPIIPEDGIEFDFILNSRPSKYQSNKNLQKINNEKIKKAMTFRFIKSDVERYELEHGFDKPDKDIEEFEKQDAQPDGLQKETTNRASDSFIKSLTVYLESNDEIKIKKYGKKPKIIKLDFLSSPLRKEFINILYDSGIYYVGKAGKKDTPTREEYDKKQKRLKSIDKKLINLIFERFSFKFSNKYKLFERDRARGSGWYKFNFQVGHEEKVEKGLESKYKKYSKDKLLEHRHNMQKEYSIKPGEKFLKRQIEIVDQVLIKEYKMTEEQIEIYNSPDADKIEILKGFSDQRF